MEVILRLERHAYAPDLNKIHTNKRVITAKGITRLEDADKFLRVMVLRNMALRTAIRLLPQEGGGYGLEWELIPQGKRQAIFRIFRYAGLTQLTSEDQIPRKLKLSTRTLCKWKVRHK